jgi:uncharacterized protein
MRTKVLAYLLLFLLVFAAFGAVGCTPDPPPPENGEDQEDPPPPPGPTFITLASGSPGGAYFPLGAGMAQMISNKVDNVVAQSTSTGASVENARLVARGEAEMGMAMANIAYNAIKGEVQFAADGALSQLVALFSMYPAPQHLIVAANSPIQSVQDLEGKRVSIDAAGSGCAVTSEIILKAAGIWDKVDARNYSQPEAADALKDGTVDAVFYNFAVGTAIINEIQFTTKLRFIPLEDELLNAVIAGHPYFTKGFIPAGAYSGLEEDVPALTIGNLMLVHKDMDADLAYEIVKAIFHADSLKGLAAIHPIGAELSKAKGGDTGIPLHPGAARFFQ